MLVLSARDSVDRRAMLAACQAAGEPAQAMTSWRVPEDLRGRSDVRLYAEALFAEVVADPLGLALLVPAGDWLTRLPKWLLGRTVTATTLGEARHGRFPIFVKPVEDKLGGFRGAVYESKEALPRDLADDLPVLTAEPVAIECELRLFCLDGRVLAGSSYWKGDAAWQAPLAETGLEARAQALVEHAWAPQDLPRACVIDVAMIAGDLVVLEANGAWGASLYASDAVAALPCVLQASLPRTEAAALPLATVHCPRLEGR